MTIIVNRNALVLGICPNYYIKHLANFEIDRTILTYPNITYTIIAICNRRIKEPSLIIKKTLVLINIRMMNMLII